MALPKEPRQKMINLMYLVLTALLALNVSSEILNAFKVVDKSLMTSNTNLTAANNTLYKSLEAKLADPLTAQKAAIWNPKAVEAQKLSADMDTYINQLKANLKKESGLEMVDGQEKFKEDDLEAATRLFGNGPGGQNEGPKLEKKLQDYKAAMLAIDPEINAKFASTFPVDVAPQIGQDGKKKEFTEAYFHMTPTVAALTLLSKFQNNVKNAENQVVTFCHEQVGAVKVKFDKTGVLIGQSSNYVMPGQELTITAGIGAYSSAAVPQISVNGASVPTVDGQGVYKLQASGGGPHSVPVTIRYKDQDGNDKVDTKNVEYVVGTPGGAAVMLDKMNVFYIGIDNPVTIGSPTGWDKTSVTMSGGTISGSGSNRTVRVSGPGAASITVNADGHATKFDFRIKRIPDPIFKVGSGKARVPAVEFKNQSACRAELENFEFDLRYSIVGATVYFSGANFPNVATASISSNSLEPLRALINRCGPGSTITFTNIRASGPDGTRIIDERSIVLY
ncbi:MAG: gliding motility protein GldM [Bacteroidetes bacterium]|nr:gliding motility protein GldM [Bacteroidota bacterium]MBS1758286.1 gliding motility protein GldM [Bacteroidota bacterium]